MISNDKVYKCACDTPRLTHTFATDHSNRHILMVDHERADLLQNVSWRCVPVFKDPKRLHARATTKAPGIRRGRCLHRLALGVTNPNRHVRALNNNALDCRRSNLQSMRRSDLAVLTRTRNPVTNLIGVRQSDLPRWLRSDCLYGVSITLGGKPLHLGSYRTADEAGAASDAAIIRARGSDAMTNVKMGLLDPKVARTKLCRKAAKKARNIVKARQAEMGAEKVQAFLNAKTPEERWAAMGYKWVRTQPQPDEPSLNQKIA